VLVYLLIACAAANRNGARLNRLLLGYICFMYCGARTLAPIANDAAATTALLLSAVMFALVCQLQFKRGRRETSCATKISYNYNIGSALALDLLELRERERLI